MTDRPREDLPGMDREGHQAPGRGGGGEGAEETVTGEERGETTGLDDDGTLDGDHHGDDHSDEDGGAATSVAGPVEPPSHVD